jgi:hypothetical protein
MRPNIHLLDRWGAAWVGSLGLGFEINGNLFITDFKRLGFIEF